MTTQREFITENGDLWVSISEIEQCFFYKNYASRRNRAYTYIKLNVPEFYKKKFSAKRRPKTFVIAPEVLKTLTSFEDKYCRLSVDLDNVANLKQDIFEAMDKLKQNNTETPIEAGTPVETELTDTIDKAEIPTATIEKAIKESAIEKLLLNSNLVVEYDFIQQLIPSINCTDNDDENFIGNYLKVLGFLKDDGLVSETILNNGLMTEVESVKHNGMSVVKTIEAKLTTKGLVYLVNNL